MASLRIVRIVILVMFLTMQFAALRKRKSPMRLATVTMRLRKNKKRQEDYSMK